jgi:hypothetical protein
MAETVKTLCRCRPTERRTWVIRYSPASGKKSYIFGSSNRRLVCSLAIGPRFGFSKLTKSLLAGRADVPMILGWQEVPGRLVHLSEAGDATNRHWHHTHDMDV